MSDAVATHGLTKYYGGQAVVDSLNLRVPRGSVYGLLGRNGSGKSTAVKMLLGLVHPDRGRAELLILDDPTIGLDTVVRRDFLESMIQIIQRQGRTILFSAHILSDVERVADRIGILVDGVLRVDCPTETFKQTVKKVVLEFSGPPPDFPACPGVVSWRHVGLRLELVTVNLDDEQRQRIEQLRPRAWEVIDLNLEDAFIEYTRGPRRSLPIFSGEHEHVESLGAEGSPGVPRDRRDRAGRVWGSLWSTVQRQRAAKASLAETYEQVVVRGDGTAAIATTSRVNYENQKWRTLDGQPLERGQQLQAGNLPGPMQLENSVPRGDWTSRIVGWADAQTSPERWYFIDDAQAQGQAWFEGFDTVTKQRIGFLGRHGFRTERLDAQERFPFDSRLKNSGGSVSGWTDWGSANTMSFGWPQRAEDRIPGWRFYLVSEGGLWEIDVRQHTVRVLLRHATSTLPEIRPGTWSSSKTTKPASSTSFAKDGSMTSNRLPMWRRRSSFNSSSARAWSSNWPATTPRPANAITCRCGCTSPANGRCGGTAPTAFTAIRLFVPDNENYEGAKELARLRGCRLSERIQQLGLEQWAD